MPATKPAGTVRPLGDYAMIVLQLELDRLKHQIDAERHTIGLVEDELRELEPRPGEPPKPVDPNVLNDWRQRRRMALQNVTLFSARRRDVETAIAYLKEAPVEEGEGGE